MRHSNAVELIKNFAVKNNERFFGVDPKYYDVTIYDYFDLRDSTGKLVCNFGRPYETPVYDHDLIDGCIRAVYTCSAGENFEQLSIMTTISPNKSFNEYELDGYCEHINKINANKVNSLFPKNNLVQESYKRKMSCAYFSEARLNGGNPCLVNELILAIARDSVIYKVPENQYEEDQLYLMNFNTMNHFFGKYILEISDYLVDQVRNEFDAYMNPPGDSFYVGIQFHRAFHHGEYTSYRYR